MEQSDDSPQEEVSHLEQVQQTSVSQVPQKTAPLGVKILSILSWIGAVLITLFGLIFLSLGFKLKAVIQQMLEEMPPEAVADAGILTFAAGFIWLFGGILLSLGILYIFIAKGLWKGKNWTRIFLIIFLSISIIFAIWGTIQGSYGYIFNLIVSVVVIGYLLFSKKVKAFFKGI